MTTLNTIIEEKIKEFDDLYIHNNVWKSDDETLAYAPIEGMRQWIHDTLTTAMQRAYEAGRGERDTYWKERVRSVVGGMKVPYNSMSDWAGEIDARNKVCDDILQALDNLK